MRRLIITALLFVAAPIAVAQLPSDHWRTVSTVHFRVHYPDQFEPWALRAASHLESIRDAVAKEVGFVPPQTVDVLVMNPIAESNGSAWPFLDTPRIIFYAEPPEPDEQLGAYAQWIDLLAVHEYAHLAHMLRPSRNPLERLLERSVLPLNPITLGAPRWVLEGYATVVEGRLTGAGRPSSTVRALILRRWAEEGRLPTYAQLNSDRRFLGMSMAYLMGSAFLEWLEQRSGPEALRHLWARLTARERRSFEGAFAGVFGDRPDKLYGRFLAELTASAVAIDRPADLREGELWQETLRDSGDPAVSPDGSELAFVVRNRDVPQKLVIWNTASPDQEEKKFSERLQKILARDPEDVPPVRSKPLPRKPVHSLTLHDGGDIHTPRWTRDGSAILFTHRVPDAEGILHFELFRWNPSSGEVRRLTRRGDIHEADPLPDGRRAIGVRSRFGQSQLVDIDLTTGAVVPHAPPSLGVVSHPRASARGAIAWITHQNGRWELLVDGVPLVLPGDASSPEWIDDQALVVTVANGGFADLYRVDLHGGSTPLTRTAGGAFDPAPSSDGRIFFTSLDPDGYVVRLLPADASLPAPRPVLPADLVPAIPPTPPVPPAIAVGEVTAPRPYGIGRQEPAWFAGVNHDPGQQWVEAGARLGDVVGRLDTLLTGAIGNSDSPRGVALQSAWRGWPVEVDAHLFTVRESPLCATRCRGVELRGIWKRVLPLGNLIAEAGALRGDPEDRMFAGAGAAARQLFGVWRIDEAVRIDATSSDDAHFRGSATAVLRSPAFRLSARYEYLAGDDVILGGLSSSLLARSATISRVQDGALPPAALRGRDYDGVRFDAKLPLSPLTAFYQRHELGDTVLALAGLELDYRIDANPILKTPRLDLTAGAARILDRPFRGDTNWWIGMRWRP